MDRCIICKEYVFGEHHKCAPRWYCLHAEEYGNGDYIPTIDIFLDEGYRVYEHRPEKAAIKFAEIYQARQDWYPPEMLVLVMVALLFKLHEI